MDRVARQLALVTPQTLHVLPAGGRGQQEGPIHDEPHRDRDVAGGGSGEAVAVLSTASSHALTVWLVAGDRASIIRSVDIRSLPRGSSTPSIATTNAAVKAVVSCVDVCAWPENRFAQSAVVVGTTDGFAAVLRWTPVLRASLPHQQRSRELAGPHDGGRFDASVRFNAHSSRVSHIVAVASPPSVATRSPALNLVTCGDDNAVRLWAVLAQGDQDSPPDSRLHPSCLWSCSVAAPVRHLVALTPPTRSAKRTVTVGSIQPPPSSACAVFATGSALGTVPVVPIDIDVCDESDEERFDADEVLQGSNGASETADVTTGTGEPHRDSARHHQGSNGRRRTMEVSQVGDSFHVAAATSLQLGSGSVVHVSQVSPRVVLVCVSDGRIIAARIGSDGALVVDDDCVVPIDRPQSSAITRVAVAIDSQDAEVHAASLLLTLADGSLVGAEVSIVVSAADANAELCVAGHIVFSVNQAHRSSGGPVTGLGFFSEPDSRTETMLPVKSFFSADATGAVSLWRWPTDDQLAHPSGGSRSAHALRRCTVHASVMVATMVALRTPLEVGNCAFLDPANKLSIMTLADPQDNAAARIRAARQSPRQPTTRLWQTHRDVMATQPPTIRLASPNPTAPALANDDPRRRPSPLRFVESVPRTPSANAATRTPVQKKDAALATAMAQRWLGYAFIGHPVMWHPPEPPPSPPPPSPSAIAATGTQEDIHPSAGVTHGELLGWLSRRCRDASTILQRLLLPVPENAMPLSLHFSGQPLECQAYLQDLGSRHMTRLRKLTNIASIWHSNGSVLIDGGPPFVFKLCQEPRRAPATNVGDEPRVCQPLWSCDASLVVCCTSIRTALRWWTRAAAATARAGDSTGSTQVRWTMYAMRCAAAASQCRLLPEVIQEMLGGSDANGEEFCCFPGSTRFCPAAPGLADALHSEVILKERARLRNEEPHGVSSMWCTAETAPLMTDRRFKVDGADLSRVDLIVLQEATS